METKTLGRKHAKLNKQKKKKSNTTRQEGDPTNTETRTDLWALLTKNQKRKHWIQVVTKAALKALKCTHVQGRKPNKKI